jgi:predicted DNA-binding antitoxin AbrB/MazE fold protein
MMSQRFPAIYENGVFRPIAPVLGLREGTSVVLTIQDANSAENEQAKRSLSSKEFRDLLRAKNPHAEIPEEEWEEMDITPARKIRIHCARVVARFSDIPRCLCE